jgi:hypothetical protein
MLGTRGIVRLSHYLVLSSGKNFEQWTEHTWRILDASARISRSLLRQRAYTQLTARGGRIND